MTRFPLKFMKEKEAATTAAVPFHWCTLLELITSITMSPSLQMNMNCHVHVLLSECMLALLASAWNVHRPERSHCASSSCDFSQSQFFVTYTHTGRKIKPTHLQWWQCPQTNTAPSCFFFMWFLTVSIFFLFVYNTMSPSLQMNMNCHVHVFIRYYWHHPLHILGIHQASRHSLDLGS